MWQFDESYSIWGARFLDDRLWMLVETGGSFAFEWMPTRPIGPESGFPYEVYGDRQIVATGTQSGTNTVYDVSAFFTDADDSTISRLVKGDDFAGNQGEVEVGGAANGWVYSGTNITVDESEFLDGEVILCKNYESSLTLTRPFRTDQRGQRIVGDKLLHEEITVSFANSGLSLVRITPGSNFQSLERAFFGDRVQDIVTGTIRVPVRQESDSVRVGIAAGSVYPMTVNGVEHDVSAEVGMRGRQ
ncbi:MAG: hypothetical protein AAFR76_14725 [Planctomycetota bacterium]